MLPTREVLDQTHDQAVFLGDIDDDCWNLSLSKSLEGLQPALPTDKLVSCLAISVFVSADSYRFLEANFGYAVDDLPKCLVVANTRIDDGNPV
jgi:hypothetical protein